jgi:hypothetical protein
MPTIVIGIPSVVIRNAHFIFAACVSPKLRNIFQGLDLYFNHLKIDIHVIYIFSREKCRFNEVGIQEFILHRGSPGARITYWTQRKFSSQGSVNSPIAAKITTVIKKHVLEKGNCNSN